MKINKDLMYHSLRQAPRLGAHCVQFVTQCVCGVRVIERRCV